MVLTKPTETDWPARVARNIRFARHLAIPRRSQHWLADQLGVDRRVVVRWENDRRGMPNIRNLERIGAVLGQPVSWFYEEHDGS